MPIKKKSLPKSNKGSSKGRGAASSTKKAAPGVKHQSMKTGASYIGETEKHL